MHRTMKLSILTLAFAGLIVSCGGRDELTWNLTNQDQYRLPSSTSTERAVTAPVVFARSSNGEVVGKMSADPLADMNDVLEQSIGEVGTQLRYVRQAMYTQAGDSVPVPTDILLALDRDLNYNEAMQVMYGVSAMGFPEPHLVTRKGMVQTIERPMMASGVPTGWSAWMWISPGDTIRWMPVPESSLDPSRPSGGVWVEKVLPTADGVDADKLAERIAATLDTSTIVPAGPDRLIGIWAYPEFPYADLIGLMDRLRFPKHDEPVGGRITLLAGSRWSPPPDSILTVRVAE